MLRMIAIQATVDIQSISFILQIKLSFQQHPIEPVNSTVSHIATLKEVKYQQT